LEDWTLYRKAYNQACGSKTWYHPEYNKPPFPKYADLAGKAVRRSWIPYQSKAETQAKGKGKGKGKPRPKPKPKPADTDTPKDPTAIFGLHVVFKRLTARLDVIKDHRLADFKSRLDAKAAEEGTTSTPARSTPSAQTRPGSNAGPPLKGDDPPARRDAPHRQLRKRLPLLQQAANADGTIEDDKVAKIARKRAADGRTQTDQPRIRRPRLPRIPNLLPGPSWQKCHEPVNNTVLASLLIRFVACKAASSYFAS
jgi:hypothetical protein